MYSVQRTQSKTVGLKTELQEHLIQTRDRIAAWKMRYPHPVNLLFFRELDMQTIIKDPSVVRLLCVYVSPFSPVL